jgi:hypothetical protein
MTGILALLLYNALIMTGLSWFLHLRRCDTIKELRLALDTERWLNRYQRALNRGQQTTIQRLQPKQKKRDRQGRFI